MADPMVLRITPSMFETFDRCGKEYDYVYNQSFESEKKPEYLEEGELAHKYLERFYSLKMFNYEALEKLPRAKMVEAAEQEAHRFSTSTELGDEAIDKVLEVCKLYTEEYLNETWVPVAVEAPFSVKLYESDTLVVLLEGKKDLVVDDGRERCVVDHKYVSADFTPVQTNVQLLCYCIAEGCHSAILNRLIKTKVPKFTRHTFYFKDSILNEFKRDLVETAIEIASRTQKGIFRRRFSSCQKFGKICRFNDVCAAPEQSREAMLKAEFQKRASASLYGLNK